MEIGNRGNGCFTRALGGAIITPPEVLVTFLRGGLGRSNSIHVPRPLEVCVNNGSIVGWTSCPGPMCFPLPFPYLGEGQKFVFCLGFVGASSFSGFRQFITGLLAGGRKCIGVIMRGQWGVGKDMYVFYGGYKTRLGSSRTFYTTYKTRGKRKANFYTGYKRPVTPNSTIYTNYKTPTTTAKTSAATPAKTCKPVPKTTPSTTPRIDSGGGVITLLLTVFLKRLNVRGFCLKCAGGNVVRLYMSLLLD